MLPYSQFPRHFEPADRGSSYCIVVAGVVIGCNEILTMSTVALQRALSAARVSSVVSKRSFSALVTLDEEFPG